MTKRITYLSLLIAIAIILGYLETFIPINFGIPGAKLGLANLIGLIDIFIIRKSTRSIDLATY